MPLNLNNQNDGYYINVFVMDPNTALYQEIRDLRTGGVSSGGFVNSPTLPMSINSGVLSINLSGYIPSSHAANNIGNVKEDLGDFDLRTQSVTLENPNGVTGIMTMDNGAHLLINGQGVILVDLFGVWAPLQLRLTDSSGNVRLLNTNPFGAPIWDNQELATIAIMSAILNNYTPTLNLTSMLSLQANSSQVLTNVPANALFTDTLYVHPSQHPIATITGLQTELNAKQDTLTACRKQYNDF